MADSVLLNSVALNGTYDSLPLDVDSNILSTLIISGLTVTKSSDRAVWLSGNLTYTITVDNQADEDYATPTLTDTIDITQVALVENSVMVGGVVTAYTYDDLTGLLTVVLPTIETGETLEVTFQVEMV